MNHREPGTEAEWAMVRLTKWIICITAVTAILAVGATIFAGLQWRSSKEAIAFSRESAHQSGVDTRKALQLSARVAAASERQSKTTEAALMVSDRLAVATEVGSRTSERLVDTARQQVETASAELRLKQAPNIDILISTSSFTRETGFKATAKITNRGTYTLNDFHIRAASNILPGESVSEVWKVLLPPKYITLVPGVDHTLYLDYPPLQQHDWERFGRGEMFLVHAVEVRFRDASGRKQIIRRCIGISRIGTKIDQCY